MKKEDIDFLKNLQNELKTQDTDCQINPRYWVVVEKVKQLSLDDWGTPLIYDSEGCESYTLEQYVEYIQKYLEENDEQHLANWDVVDKTNVNEVIDFAETYFCIKLTLTYYEEKYQISPNTFFLTKKEAQKHIDNNSYHYTEPHTYGMTAWRSPEFERFLKIFTEMNIDDIKVE